MSTCHQGVACIGKRAAVWHLLYISYIYSNGRHGYNYFQVGRDAASIRGWLPFEVMRRTWRAQWTKCSISPALCMGTTSTIECGLHFEGRLCLLPWQRPFPVLHTVSFHSQLSSLCSWQLNAAFIWGRLYTIVLCSLLSAASIRGQPLNGLRRLFKQIRYVCFSKRSLTILKALWLLCQNTAIVWGRGLSSATQHECFFLPCNTTYNVL